MTYQFLLLICAVALTLLAQANLINKGRDDCDSTALLQSPHRQIARAEGHANTAALANMPRHALRFPKVQKSKKKAASVVGSLDLVVAWQGLNRSYDDGGLDRVKRDQLKAVFGRLAPYDEGEVVAPAYEADGRTLLALEQATGWNNHRMSWEETVCYAFRSRRIFRVPVITPDLGIMNASFNGRTSIDLFTFYDERSFKMRIPSQMATDPTPGSSSAEPNQSMFSREPSNYTEDNLIYDAFGESRTFGEYVTDERLVPHEQYVALIESAFKIRWELLDRAISRLTENGLVPGQYVAIHRRRGDFDETYNIDVNTQPIMDNLYVVEFLMQEVKDKQVLVVTDEYDSDFLVKLKEIGHATSVTCWADKRLTGEDAVFSIQTDMLAAVAAKTFIGTPYSTVSTGIERWRVQSGWHKLGDPVKYITPYTNSGYGWESPGGPGTILFDETF